MKMLEQQSAEVDYNAPHIPTIKTRRKHKQFIGKQSVSLDQLNAYYLTVILTDHLAYDYDTIVKQSNWAVDTRNACGNINLIKSLKT
jgi:UDP-N-acetyl-D-glucosamine dehydrogenase